MDFSELQQSWQAQAAPPAAPAGPATEAASLLAETERLHHFGQRRNWLGTILITGALACFVGAQLLRGRIHTSLQWLGLGVLSVTMLGFIAAMWWGTTLRAAARPGLNSRAYLAASLRAFRFRRTVLLWLGIPYVLGIGSGLILWNLPHFQAVAPYPYEEWLPTLGLPLLLLLSLWSRAVGLRKYEQQFGPTERALAHWQRELLAEN